MLLFLKTSMDYTCFIRQLKVMSVHNTLHNLKGVIKALGSVSVQQKPT
jgi:hypothetical protein